MSLSRLMPAAHCAFKVGLVTWLRLVTDPTTSAYDKTNRARNTHDVMPRPDNLAKPIFELIRNQVQHLRLQLSHKKEKNERNNVFSRRRRKRQRVTTDFDAREIRFFRNLEAKSLRHAHNSSKERTKPTSVRLHKATIKVWCWPRQLPVHEHQRKLRKMIWHFCTFDVTKSNASAQTPQRCYIFCHNTR